MIILFSSIRDKFEFVNCQYTHSRIIYFLIFSRLLVTEKFQLHLQIFMPLKIYADSIERKTIISKLRKNLI